MEYDFLFKRLLKAFFRFFMELFFPQVAAQIWQQAVVGNVGHPASADSQGPIGPQYGPKENRP